MSEPLPWELPEEDPTPAEPKPPAKQKCYECEKEFQPLEGSPEYFCTTECQDKYWDKRQQPGRPKEITGAWLQQRCLELAKKAKERQEREEAEQKETEAFVHQVRNAVL
jgi:hypothetical protein